MPLWYNKHLPGQSASIIITFEFFRMFVSTRFAYPSVFLGGRESRACFRNNTPFLTFNLFSMVKWLRYSTAFCFSYLWLVVFHWWTGSFVNKFRHFGYTIVMCIVQGRNEVRWRLGQETSLLHPCSNLRSFGSKCSTFKKVLMTLLGLFAPQQWFDTWGIVPSCPIATSLVFCKWKSERFLKANKFSSPKVMNICNFRTQYRMDLAQTANKGYWRHFRFIRVTSMPPPCIFSTWTCVCFANNKTFRIFNQLLF